MTGPAASSRGFLRSASATPSEIDATRRAMEPVETAAAASRETAGVNQCGNFPPGSTGKTRDKIGAFAGGSGRRFHNETPN
jgi:hypothetical protein